MTIPTQSEIIRDLTDEIMQLIETDTAERDLIESAANVHFTRFMQATHERLDRAAREQRERLNIRYGRFVELYDED